MEMMEIMEYGNYLVLKKIEAVPFLFFVGPENCDVDPDYLRRRLARRRLPLKSHPIVFPLDVTA